MNEDKDISSINLQENLYDEDSSEKSDIKIDQKSFNEYDYIKIDFEEDEDSNVLSEEFDLKNNENSHNKIEKDFENEDNFDQNDEKTLYETESQFKNKSYEIESDKHYNLEIKLENKFCEDNIIEINTNNCEKDSLESKISDNLTCKVCDLQFLNAQDFQFHINEMKHPFKCEKCSFKTEKESYFQNHVEIIHAHPRIFLGTKNTDKFYNDNIDAEIMKILKANGIKPRNNCLISDTDEYEDILKLGMFDIDTCEKSIKDELIEYRLKQSVLKYPNEPNFIFHESYENIFSCDIWNHSEKSQRALKFHIKPIHEDNVYACEQCDYKFTFKK